MANFNNQMFASLDMDPLQPMAWDSVLDQHMITNYNQMLQTTPEYYGSLDSSTSSAASPSSDGSSPRSSSISSSKVTTEVRGAIPDKVERRREQNRQSQRAYRDRKEKHQRDLESQIAVWREKHEKLCKSYAVQSEEVSQLKAQVEELNSQIVSLQSGLPDTWGQIDQSQQDFDLVPFYDRKSGSWSRDAIDS